jgi:hypothetical protein
VAIGGLTLEPLLAFDHQDAIANLHLEIALLHSRCFESDDDVVTELCAVS